ncbi:hypothetical protein J7M02_00730 [Candidatus Aerophobetes bacterium]|nr:hypothetical protein [Candidatus Aerophobetes bacterium]
MVEKRIYPYKVDTVFKFLKDICGKSPFVVKTVDESVHQIIISTRPSLLSYGENIEIIVQPEGDNETLVYIKSEPKAFFNITAKHTIKRNVQSIYRMLEEMLHKNI